MDTVYYGLAAAGAIALMAFFVLRRNHASIQKPTQLPTPIRKISDNATIQAKSSQPLQTKVQQQKKPVQQVLQTLKTPEQLQTEYSGLYFGSFRLKASNSMHIISAIDFKGPKLLLATTKNQLTLFNLKQWKKDTKHSMPAKYFVSLDNNGATAVCIGQKYYYAALNFDKTIVYYQFIGEGGIYFKEVAKFARNILKSNASAIHVDKNQRYIITAGTGADTVLDVWSMKGEKLASANSFQIQHYSVSCGLKNIIIRGWTSQIKIFMCVEEKDGSFKKLEKSHHLAHDQSPLSSSICNRDMYAISISKTHKPKIWSLFQSHHPEQHTSDSIPQMLTKCALYTFETAVGHFKTLAVLSNTNGFVITDIHLNVVHKVEGIQVKQLYMNGTNKLVLLGVVNGQGQLMLWNLTKDVEKVGEVNL